MRTNQEYKNIALAALRGTWAQAIVATFIVFVLDVLLDCCVLVFNLMGNKGVFGDGAWAYPVQVGAMSLTLLLVMFFLVLPLLANYINSFSSLCYKSDKSLLAKMKSFSIDDSLHVSSGILVMSIITSICSMVLIVPGVIASLALFLTPYLLNDYPDLSVIQTLRLSNKMMKGHKMRLFKLQLSFVGWILLSMLTLGIGLLWLLPYMMTTMAAFHQDVREQYIMKEGQQESAL